jgi:environmental stress-induced protein Ves
MNQWLVDANQIPAQPWRNGGGSTRELLAWPTAHDWLFRISLAQVAQDGPFSSFPGIERWIALVEGAGMTLRFASGSEPLSIGREPLRFDGALAPACSLERGTTLDLNLMVDRSRRSGLLACAGDAEWTDASEWRGAFAASPCTLWIDDGPPVELGPMVLLARQGVARERWRLTTRGAAVRAWWIAVA